MPADAVPSDAPLPDASTEVALAVRALMPALKRQSMVAVGIITVVLLHRVNRAGWLDPAEPDPV